MTHPTPTIPRLGLVLHFKLDGCFGEPVRAHILNLNCQTVISADQIWTRIMLLCTSWAKMFSETDFSLLFHCNVRAFGPGCHYFPTWKQTQNRANSHFSYWDSLEVTFTFQYLLSGRRSLMTPHVWRCHCDVCKYIRSDLRLCILLKETKQPTQPTKWVLWPD